MTVRIHSATAPESPPDTLTAELHAYNRAFLELELPWRWDVDTYRQLRSAAPDGDCVSVYIERSHAHLLRAYDPQFLRSLVHSVKDRLHSEALS
jgi:hypothetical protein